jgi:hypothetical protein
MSKLAQEFGLSDVGLKKVCRRNGIPTPGLGHWRLLETGHSSKRVPLPSIQGGRQQTITIAASEPKPYEIPVPKQPAPEIEIGENREISHPLAIQTKRLLRHTTKDKYEILSPKDGNANHVNITANTLPRVLRILDGLLHAIEKQGYQLNWPKEPKANLVIIVDSQPITFQVSEAVERKPHVLTKQEVERRKNSPYAYAPEWDYFGTSRLRLSIESVPYGARNIRKSWGDAKTQRLENCLGDFIVALPGVAAAIKFHSEERERQHQLWLDQQRHAEEERRRQAEYKRKLEVVSKLAQDLREANLMRDFVDALKKGARSPAVSVEHKLGVVRIIDWAERHANSLDPLIDLDAMIRQFDNRSD